MDGQGEVHGTLTYLVRVRPKRGARFFMLDYQTEAMEKFLLLRLPASALQVFFYALTHVERRNEVVLPLADVGPACKLTQAQVSIALKKLCEAGALVAFRRELRREFMVNPAFGWNGAVPEYADGLKLWEARVLAAANKGKQRDLALANP